MNAIQSFHFENQSVRIILDENNQPLFVAKDVAVTLGYLRPNDAIKQHCKGAVKHRTLSTKGGNQEMRVIYEPDVYRLIFGSKLESAVKFQNWVFDEVLPTIRKTGQYRHTLSTEQQHAIQKCVRQKCLHNSTHYQTVYTALKDKFGVPSYKDILASDFDEAVAFIMQFEFAVSSGISPNIAFMLAHHTRQIKEAQDEFWGVMGEFASVLERLGELQIRLEKSEQCVYALQRGLMNH
ncbi:ORF6C domain-containing protein [Moraxella bovis]|uniref:BRO family protein n=1 Tax=Moraxella bovis TaxID=476 RepID=UPI0009922292|nr:BRO family protein [Moraxella bovis]OOR87006.1 hypothetical protein B0182_13450 [Moraxella bovis]UZA17743.1 ORF6C domain-containing protein [Moraxella bovis]